MVRARAISLCPDNYSEFVFAREVAAETAASQRSTFAKVHPSRAMKIRPLVINRSSLQINFGDEHESRDNEDSLINQISCYLTQCRGIREISKREASVCNLITS